MWGIGSLSGAEPRVRSNAALASLAAALVLTAGCAPTTTSKTPVSGGAGNGDGGLFDVGGEPEGLPTPGGSIVAEIEMPVPPAIMDSFVVRATIPVPKGVFPRPDGKYPFSIRNIDGMCAPTQMEIVSRYPNGADGADVVEVLARVDRPANAQPGQKIRYEVVENLHAQRRLPIKSAVMNAIVAPNSFKLIAEDCFGNTYSRDILKGMRSQTGAVKVLKQGQAAVEMRTYGALMPTGSQIGAPNGALPHFFGVHAYVTTWAQEDFMTVDLRVNNGQSGSDKAAGAIEDDPLGDVYFKRLTIEIPQGWQMLCDINDPFLGAPSSVNGRVQYDLVQPDPSGALHLMPAQAMFHRRIALTRNAAAQRARAALDETTLGFAAKGVASDSGMPLYSWWNHNTARFGPQRFPMPDLTQMGLNGASGECWTRYTQASTRLTQGDSAQHPFDSPVMGWCQPWGVGYGGMTGGTEIWFYDGFKVADSASQVGYRALELTHRMYCARMPQVLYDADGEHTGLERWLVHGPNFDYVNMTYFQGLISNSNDPFGYNQSPAYQRNWVVSQGLTPAYETNLRSYKPIDFQHYVRFLHTPIALAWLGNDSLAKDDLRMAAEIFRMSYQEHPVNSGGYVLGSSLLCDMNTVSSNPGIGFSFGRGESWGTMSAIAAYSLSEPSWRARWTPWFQKIADTVSAGQSACNGIIQRTVNSKILGGQFQARQSIEQAITENMLWSLKESVFRDVDAPRLAQTEQTIVNSTYAMIGPMAWSPNNGPHSHMAVAPLNSGTPYCGSIPAGGSGNGIDKYQTPCSFAYGYALTGDATFLQKAAEMYGSSNLPASLASQYLYNAETRAALMAIVQ